MHERKQANPSQVTILIVEDSPQSMRILQRILLRQGYVVQTATTGVQALAIVHRLPIDVILLDIKMPEMDGFEVCKHLQADERTREIPVIFISALDEIFDKVKAFSVGGVDYITKPFQAEEVVARVGMHLKVWQIKRQLQAQNLQLQQEIHERTHTEALLQRRNHELELINRVGQMLSSSLDLDRVLQTALEEIHRLLNVISTSFWLLDSDTRELVCREAFGSGSDALLNWRLKQGQGITGWVAQHGKSLLISDALTDDRHFTMVDQQTGLPVRSMLSIPLRVQGRVIGVLNLVDPKPNHFTAQDLRFVEPIAAAAAIAIENAKFYAQSQQELLERRKTQQALQRAKNEAVTANRAKNMFLANISHEFRTPLNAILGFSHLLFTSQQPLTPEQKEYVQIIQQNGEHLLELITQVLDFSKIEAGRMTLHIQDFDLFEMIDDLAAIFIQRARAKHLVFHVFREPAVPKYIRTDENKLREVLFNLLSNAVKFTKEGEVGFTIKHKEDGIKRVLDFSIADTGQGIVSDENAREPQGGLGLGLTMSRKFAQLMGGKLTEKSKPGEGTVVRFEIPVEVVEPSHIPPGIPFRQTIRPQVVSDPAMQDSEVMRGSVDELSASQLTVLPYELLSQLEQAAITTDFTTISHLLQQIPSERTTLFTALNQLVQHFEYTQILTLVQEAQKMQYEEQE